MDATTIFWPPSTATMVFSLPSLEEAAALATALRSLNLTKGVVVGASIRTRIRLGDHAVGPAAMCTDLPYVGCISREVLVGVGSAGALLLGFSVGCCLRRKVGPKSVCVRATRQRLTLFADSKLYHPAYPS